MPLEPQLKLPRRVSGRLPVATFVVVTSKLVTAGANAVALVVLAHTLSADSFGVFGGVLAATLILGRLLTFGVDHALLRLRATPAYRGDDGALIADAALVIALGSAMLLLAASTLSLTLPQAVPVAVWASAAAAVGWGSVEVAYWAFLARRRFGAALATQAGTAAVRLAAVLAIAATAPSQTALLVGWAGAGLALGAAWLLQAALAAGRPSRERMLALLRYGRWQGFAQTLAALGAQQGVLLLLFVGGKEAEAGALSLAISLSFAVFLLYQAFMEHLALEVAKLEPGGLPRFLRRSLATTGGLVLLAAAGLAAIHQLGRFFLPQDVWRDGDVFIGVAVSALLVIAHAPFEAALHGRLNPRPIFWSRILRLVIVGLVGSLIAVRAGAEAMGWLHAAASGASLAYVAALFRQRIDASSRAAPDAPAGPAEASAVRRR